MILDDFNDYKYRPKWLRKLMHERQVEQGNPLDSIIFNSYIDVDKRLGGFDYHQTKEGRIAWQDAIYRKDYTLLLKANPDIIPEEGDTMKGKPIKAWVATDEDGLTFIFEHKPIRGVMEWWGDINFEDLSDNLPFPAPTWEDEPVQVEITIKKV